MILGQVSCHRLRCVRACICDVWRVTCDLQGLSSNFVAYMRLTITFTLGMTRLRHSCACGCSVILLLLAGYFLSDTVIMLTNRSRINVARHCRKNCALRFFLL
jgi:hypothetical protein